SPTSTARIAPRTAGRPSGRTATPPRGLRRCARTAARSARTAISSWPYRSWPRSGRSAGPSSGTDASGTDAPATDAGGGLDRPPGLAQETVGDALDAADRFVALHALDAAHRIEERDQAEAGLAPGFLAQVVLEAGELDAAHGDARGRKRLEHAEDPLAR